MEEKLNKERFAVQIEKMGEAVRRFFKGGSEIEAVNFELHWPPRVI